MVPLGQLHSGGEQVAGGNHVANSDLFQDPWGQLREGDNTWGSGRWYLLEVESGWEWRTKRNGGRHHQVTR